MGDTNRPASFSEFVGQERPRKVLEILCRAAKKKGTCLPHVLLSGPPGLGKTSLARIVASEMGSRLVEVVAGNIQAPDQMAKQLMRLKEGDVLFLDEGHSLGREVEETLYGALQDGRLSVVQSGYDEMMKGLGLGRKESKVASVELPPFTCILATTLSGLVSDPLRSRFPVCLTLEPYSDEELARIVANSATGIQFKIGERIAMELARRSRATARTAIANVRWFSEYCAGTDSKPDMRALDEAFALKEVTPEGLTKVDVLYLSALVEAGEPLGLSTLAASTGESEETLAQATEPFLIRKNFVRKGPRGRVATAKAVELLNGKAA